MKKEGRPTTPQRRRFPLVYSDRLQEMLRNDPGLKPSEGAKALTDALKNESTDGTLPSDLPDLAKIRSKISCLKSLANVQKRRDTL